MADQADVCTEELHILSNQIVCLLNTNVKFNLDVSVVASTTELFFEKFILRIFSDQTYEIEFSDNDFLQKLKNAITNFNYPGLVLPNPLKHNYNTIIVNAYNKYLDMYFDIKTKFPKVQTDVSNRAFRIVGVDEMPFHIYHAIKTRTILSVNYIHKKYFRVMKNENDLE
jgi:hypothetical protein